jgi:hypothetical protein
MASFFILSKRLSAPISEPTKSENMPFDIIHYLADWSLADTAKIGHDGLYLATVIADCPELVKTIISLALIS